jgi:hypothetical protein
MSSNLLALPFRPVINQNGEFESGALMTVYKAGTTTLEPLFANAEKTVPVNNPVTADGFGVFPPIYFSDTQPVRVLIKQSDGTTLFDVDPYISTVFEAEAILDEAATAVLEANASKEDAQAAAAAAALSEAIVVALTGTPYASTAAGIAATSNGDYFYVNSSGTIKVYLNNSGTAVLQYDFLTATEVASQIAAKANATHTHVISDVTNLQTTLDAKAPLASPALTGTPTAGGIEIGYRDIPRRTTTTTAVVGDRGGCIALAAGITIPASVFSAGASFALYNNSASPVTITQGSGLTLRQAATTTTGNRTLAARGMATIWFNSATEAIISGPGVT